jgi:hypothetical protein
VALLAEEGKQYAGYFKLRRSISLPIEMPAGKYVVSWFDAVSGEKVISMTLKHAGGEAMVHMPAQVREYALSIRAE